MSAFEPTLLVSPRGNDHLAKSPREFNNLVVNGYRVKNVDGDNAAEIESVVEEVEDDEPVEVEESDTHVQPSGGMPTYQFN